MADQKPLSGIQVFGENRLRLETAQQNNLPDNAIGLTHLIRVGAEMNVWPRISALIEGEAVFALVDQFNNGTGNQPDRPLIPDPDSLNLNRLQLQYAFAPETHLTVGRQRLAIDDQRFLAPAAFRQNDQTFDAVHFSSRTLGGSVVQAGYFNRVNRVLGGDNPVGEFRGDSWYLNLNVPTPIGRLGAFHYAFDLGTADPTPLDNVFSSQTSGVRLDGRYHRGFIGLDWEASYAHQTDYAANPSDYAADYWLVGLQAFIGSGRVRVRYESFGGDGQDAFQAPLSLIHRFQGAADVFTSIPDSGLQDLEFEGRWNFGTVGPFSGVSTALSYHRFEPDNSGPSLGQEIDVDLVLSWRDFSIAFTAAHYDANSFSSDTTRFYLSLTHRF